MASYHHNTMKLNNVKTVKKCFIIQSGKTLNCKKQVMKILHDHVPELTVVDKVEECDFILVFCLVASRAGTDIERALQKLHNNSDTKHAVVVVLHYTHDSECFVPDSSRCVQREKTITVDVLFHEDQGLLQCTKNTESLAKVINYLKPQLQKETHLPPPQESPSVFRRFLNIFTSSYESTENNDKSKERVGSLEDQELLKTELKLVLRGKSNSSKIMDTIKREINNQTDTFFQQSKMKIVEVDMWELIVVDTLDSGFRSGHVSQSSEASHDYYFLVVPVDEPTEWILNRMEELFGRQCWRNTVIIFTGTKEGQSENQDIMRRVEECGISFLCLNVHENINSSHVSQLLKKVEMKVDENQDSEIHKVIQSQITTIKENIKDKERKHEKLKTDILNFETSIEREINDHESEVNRISDILQSDIEEMNNEVTAEGFKRSLQLRVNKTVREMKQKVKSLGVTLKREKSKIDKNWGVNKGGAGVDDHINLVSNLERKILHLKSKMQKYMKQNRTHVSMLEKKDKELEKKNTVLEVLMEWKTVLEQENTVLKKELEKVRKVEGSITREKRPVEEGQGEEMCQDDEKEQIIKKHGQDQHAQRDDKNNQSDEEQSSEEHVKRDTLKLRDGETDGPRVDKAEKEIKVHEGEQRGKEEGCISKEKREKVLRPEQIGEKEQTDREEGQGGDGRGQRERRKPVME